MNPAAPGGGNERLHGNLAAQRAASAELEALLGQERERLAARDWAALQSLSADKNRVVQRLHNLHRDLLHLCGDVAPTRRLEACGLGDEWQALLDQAQRLQNSNREIRVLLDRQRERADAALRLMDRSGAGAAAGTYGRLGLSRLAPQRQRLASA